VWSGEGSRTVACPRPLCKSVMLSCRCWSWVVGVYGCSWFVCVKNRKELKNRKRGTEVVLLWILFFFFELYAFL